MASNLDSSPDATLAQRVQACLAIDSFKRTLPPMAVSGALLGPNLDNFHSHFGVLTYTHPLTLTLGGTALLTTDWWVPPLFAVAGVGIGALYLLLDAALVTPLAATAPRPRAVAACIALFMAQYYASGALHAAGTPSLSLALLLSLPAALGFWVFDRTAAGLAVSGATAVLGPAIELALVNFTHLYTYAGADFFGIDSWIPVVYFLGGPAVGGLARAVHTEFGRRSCDNRGVQ